MVSHIQSHTMFFNLSGRSNMKISDTWDFIFFLLFYEENFSVALWLCACTEVLPNANWRLPSGRVAVYHLEAAYCWRHELPHPPVVERERLLHSMGLVILLNLLQSAKIKSFSLYRDNHVLSRFLGLGGIAVALLLFLLLPLLQIRMGRTQTLNVAAHCWINRIYTWSFLSLD